MNAGYASIVVMGMTLILLASGWKPLLFGSISGRGLVAFATGWIALSFVQVPIGGWPVNGTLLLLAGISVWAAARQRKPMDGAQLLASGVMVGLFGFLVHSLAEGAPMLLPSPDGFLTCWLALLIFCLYRKPLPQIGVLSLAVLTEALLHQYANSGAAALGYGVWQDRWWVYLVVTRLTTILLAAAARMVRDKAGRLAARRKKARD